MTRPFGYFVHHQGRGHAQRCAALVEALPTHREVTIFCARPDIFGTLPGNAEIVQIPSLFEADAPPAGDVAHAATPATLHCAPLGWPGIRGACATILDWCARADPELVVVDVSAEIAQLLRIASVPVVKVLQHGRRDDPGHRAAYEGASGLLAPYHADLEQPERAPWMTARTCFAPGLGVTFPAHTDRARARDALALPRERELVVAVSGGGGQGLPLAPLCVGARARPGSLWAVMGKVDGIWHATVPANLSRLGWVDDVETWLAAADVVVAPTGNSLSHQIMAAGRPWLAVPEWRYFDEQLTKARRLSAAGAAALCEHWPASADDWQAKIEMARAIDPRRQRALTDPRAADAAAAWLERLAARLWHRVGDPVSLAAE